MLDIPNDQLFVAYKIISNDETIKDEDIDKYVQGIWIQKDEDKKTAYKPIPCSECPLF